MNTRLSVVARDWHWTERC